VLGLTSVIAWGIAEIPQIITNFRTCVLGLSQIQAHCYRPYVTVSSALLVTITAVLATATYVTNALLPALYGVQSESPTTTTVSRMPARNYSHESRED